MVRVGGNSLILVQTKVSDPTRPLLTIKHGGHILITLMPSHFYIKNLILASIKFHIT